MITVTFEQGTGFSPRIVRIVTDSTLAQVTTAGWYSQTAPNQLQPTDELEIAYAQGTGSAATAFFSVSIAAGVVTLSVAESGVVLPVVSGDFAVFSGTSGSIADLGYSPTNPALAKVSMFSGTSVANALPVFADTAGSIKPASTTTTLGFSLNVTGTVTGSTGLVATTGNVTASAGNLVGLGLSYGATPIAQVDPGSCTITAAAGAANTSTVTIQLKDGSGTNLTQSVLFRVYSSSASNGLTLQGAASTGYSVASGGLSLANGSAVTTQITAMSSATGGCVLSLLDTGKQTSYLVLVLPNGNKISAQLSAGSYG